MITALIIIYPIILIIAIKLFKNNPPTTSLLYKYFFLLEVAFLIGLFLPEFASNLLANAQEFGKPIDVPITSHSHAYTSPLTTPIQILALLTSVLTFIYVHLTIFFSKSHPKK